MGRPTEGWTIRIPTGSRNYSVRFTHRGRPYELSTRESDPERASTRAGEIYSDVVSGRAEQRRVPAGRAFDEVAAEWLAATETERDERTNETYLLYVRTHLHPVFKTIDVVTDSSMVAYRNERLRHVEASTVRKELSALRGMLRWLYGEDPARKHQPIGLTVPSVPKRATGTRHKQGRRGQPPELTELEIRAWLRKLPRRLRAYYLVLWETGLRPATVQALRTPDNFVPGRARLWIADEQDKARDGRWVPLSRAATRALDSACPLLPGPIFRIGDHRWAIRRAAKRALSPDKAELLTTYHLRGARITHWLEQTGNVAGVMHLVGHKRLETTSRYLRPSERAAEGVLGKVSGKRPNR